MTARFDPRPVTERGSHEPGHDGRLRPGRGRLPLRHRLADAAIHQTPNPCLGPRHPNVRLRHPAGDQEVDEGAGQRAGRTAVEVAAASPPSQGGPVSETTTFSIGVSKKYLATLLDCVIRRNDRRWARTHAITGVICIWIAVAVAFVTSFLTPGDPRDGEIGVMIFLVLGFTEFWKASFFRLGLGGGYLMRSE